MKILENLFNIINMDGFIDYSAIISPMIIKNYLLLFDCYYILLIFIIIICRFFGSGLNTERLRKLIILIIIGLFIQILILFMGFSSMQTFSFLNEHFIYSPFIIYLKIFICIVAICIFFSMLDYFKYESFISYELLLLSYYV
jgi:hypothetical protein